MMVDGESKALRLLTITQSKHFVIMKLQTGLLALVALFGGALAQDDEVVCYSGIVMDTYCVELGVLLDNSSVETLRNPELHSLHCLVDVPRCVNGGYEMLAPTPEGSEYPFGRFLLLDQAGNEQVVALAQSVGNPASCSTCSGTMGNEVMNFRATVIGTVIPGADGALDRLATQNVLTFEEGCPEGMTVLEPNADDLSFEQGGAQAKILSHASLMLIGWGFFLPLGILSARFLRHRPNNLWFKMHRVLQLFGLLLALVGWAIALKNFQVLESGGSGTSALEKKAWAHAVCGTTTMCMGLLQPLNALLRPHAPEDGETKQQSRFLWELVHKGMGYIGTILALVTIGLGTRIIASYENQFLAGFIASLVVLAVVAFIMVVDGIRYKKKNGGKQASTVEQPTQHPESEPLETSTA